MDSVSSFLLITFSILDSFWLFFFIKWPENCFTVEISNNFTFFNQKDILIPILSIVLCKNIFVFWYSYMITDFKLWVFAIMLNTIIYIPDLTFTGFILSVLWYMLFCSSRLSFVFQCHCHATMILLIYCKTHCHVLFGLRRDWSKNFFEMYW